MGRFDDYDIDDERHDRKRRDAKPARTQRSEYIPSEPRPRPVFTQSSDGDVITGAPGKITSANAVKNFGYIELDAGGFVFFFGDRLQGVALSPDLIGKSVTVTHSPSRRNVGERFGLSVWMVEEAVQNTEVQS